MRVISGIAKGNNLKTLNTLETRPTSDRVKESLFNIINMYIYNSNVLDIFAGSGALGIEALSRGAKRAVFVEKSKKAAGIIKQNLEHTKLMSYSEIENTDAIMYLKNCKEKFDLIFLDPPYHSNLIVPVIESIDKYSILNLDGLIVAECDEKETVPDAVLSYILFDKRSYGRVVLSFYRKAK